MSGYVARIDKHSIAFGMLWNVLPGVDRAGAEIKKLASDFKASGYVSLPVEGARPRIGMLSETAFLEKGASRASACSAAALLSIVFRESLKNAVFGIRLTNGKAAFIGFVDGYPLIGFDKVVSLDMLDDVTAEYLKELTPEQAATVEFFSTDGLFAGRIVSPVEKAWFGTVPKKAIAAARVRRAKSRVLLWVSLAVAVAAAGFGLDAYSAHQKEAAKKAVHAIVDPNALYKQSATAYLAAAGFQSGFVASAAIQRINAVPMFHEGWRIQNAACKTATDSIACVVNWKSEGGTFLSFSRSPVPGIPVYRTEYKDDGTIDVLFDFPLKAPHGIKPEQAMSKERFTLGYGSTAQTMKDAGLNIAFGKATVIALPPSPAGSPPITETTIKEPIREGSWTMTGSWMFYSSLTDMPENMTLDALQMAVSGDNLSMTATGKYYVKN